MVNSPEVFDPALQDSPSERLAAASRVPVSAAKPLLRGRIHAAAALLMVAFAFVLVTGVKPSLRVPLAIYSGCLIELYAVSATYHMLQWHGRGLRLLRTLDHSNIYVTIAATATAFAAFEPSARMRIGLTVLVWLAAGAGISAKVFAQGMSRALSTWLYVAMGVMAGSVWLALWLNPGQSTAAHAATHVVGIVLLLVLGGLLHMVGALVYARRWPDPWPRIFGFHEVFHVFVVMANGAISLAVLVILGIGPFS